MTTNTRMGAGDTLSDYDFDLPEERIALRPARPRDSARLLVVRPGTDPHAPTLEDRIFRDLPAYLRAGDVLVFNDTRVIPAQLSGRRVREGAGSFPRVSCTLHKRVAADAWLAFAKPGKKLKAGDRILFGLPGGGCAADELWATVAEKREGGEILLKFDYAGAVLDEVIARVGDMPLPPYIAARRKPDIVDREDYQTVFARREGAVAAPTAGLHFTKRLLAEIEAKGVHMARVTLHVGAGTFLPVKSERIEEHRMHAEWGEVPQETADILNAARERGGRIVCVGTTSVRILETAADERGIIHPFTGETDIFIRPGYRFRAVDLMITNFHLPRSTLFMLVSAFSGLDTMKAAYAHAIAKRYRFYSYGDATLLYPAPVRERDCAS
ncbi:tRNA preQ1(34) S-adenosylmethionine ribosyltransferase-isomerase QueA [Thermopetrobacter sp. TC1]|uniref:tRNA preQ1(34) S-adenosylmethionine ribosyltransferase-isomerase QueA n=1 Tax=Thermopetrobacter sp. TC1 TaxID=1495045 RepID=UPI001E46B6AF|nr:tRNA preQ1(34) S-adenosylmethionine ribosyltransferase-isomerase QueA [Thermopetrobacter sp. TC1]